MAGSPLNHSWPSFSKIWMKRWSFKRASECKPCSDPCGAAGGPLGGPPSSQPYSPSDAGTGSFSSLSPASIAEDVFFSRPATEDQEDSCSVISNYDFPDADSSREDLQALSFSLQGSEYFRDLQGGVTSSVSAATVVHSAGRTHGTQTQSIPPLSLPRDDPTEPGGVQSGARSGLVVTQISPVPGLLPPGGARDTRAREDPVAALSLTIHLDQLSASMEPTRPDAPAGSGDVAGAAAPASRVDMEDVDPDLDGVPILVRSMSTSRRHSWVVPLSPFNVGRRLSLDTTATDSDGERELDESDGPRPPYVREKVMKFNRLGRQQSSGAEPLAAEFCQASHISQLVETSKQAVRAAGDTEEPDPEENLHSAEGQSHMMRVQRVLQELRLYHGAKQRGCRAEARESGSVTWYEFLNNENEEEDGAIGKVEKGTKVKRTLSSLRSRVTGSFTKDKGKNRDNKEQQKERVKEREPKEKVCRSRSSGSTGHYLMPGSFSSYTTCSLCSKSLQRKHGLQCMNCAVNVHKNCGTLLGDCNSSKRENKTSLSSNLALRGEEWEQREQPGRAAFQTVDGPHRSSGMTFIPRGSSSHPTSTSSSLGFSLRHSSSSSGFPGEMDETDAFRLKRPADDVVSLAPSTTESIIVEDAHYAAVRADLESDALDLEAESWSLSVDQQCVKKYSKEMVKRQDVIYELMQTEMHHVRTLKIMLRVYVRELKENLQMDPCKLDCLFPRLENLLELHTHFLSRLKARRRDSLLAPSERNYFITRLAEVLIEQFSGELGDKMKESYGDFCSRHLEAVSFYKEQLQNNKKFQHLIRKINNLSIVRRLGVTECILLVTQRITKYPVLVERILQNTEAGTEEHDELTRALVLIKDGIAQVDVLVNVHEKTLRLRDIHNKMEPKALGKIKDGRVFRREDLAPDRRTLLHKGTVHWKAASGRLKDILAVLLSDVLLLLQEKDQRYMFAMVDNKPSVISLQKLIVREVAHEEKAMFLICTSSKEPEMYEIHTVSKEERNTWMSLIRQAAESCPHTEERLFSEEEEARAVRFKEFQDRLNQKDAVVVSALTEKLQLFAEMAETVAGLEDTASRSRLLLRGDASDLQQGEALLKGAITEVENLQNLLQSGVRQEEDSPSPRLEDGSSSGILPRRAGTFGGYDGILTKNGSVRRNEARSRDRSQRASSDPQLKDICGSHTLEHTVEECCSPPPASWNRIWSNSFPEAEFFDRVLMLSQRLYSLQAIISQQDSHMELQRASLPVRHRGNILLEQEKQRTLALQREELASFHKLQAQHRLEQQRWEKERQRHRQQLEATEERLHHREEECMRMEERLKVDRDELELHRKTYQQDLERLRESTRAVEREKERLEHQRKIKRKTIEVAPLSGSLNGELLLKSDGSTAATSDLPVSQKPLARTSMSMAPADHQERPEVSLRREASAAGGVCGAGGALPAKTEVPLHLFSTTNQQHKVLGVQQQIPTKLALLSRGKDKATKSVKGTHRSDSSASLDTRQMLPLKLSAREDGSQKAKRSVSPHQQSLSLQHHSDPDGSSPDRQSPVLPAALPSGLPKAPTPPAQPLPAPPAQSPGSPHYHGQLQGSIPQGSIPQGPNPQGPGHQGPIPQGPIPQGSIPQGPNPQGPNPQGPNHQGPGHQGPGHQGPGYQGPNPQGPNPQGPGHQGPGHQGPGHQGPGYQGPNPQGPGYQAPNHSQSVSPSYSFPSKDDKEDVIFF